MFDQSLIRKIAEAHCQRDVDSMSLDELRNAAMDSRMSELQNAAGGVSQDDLLDSLLMRFDGDTDLVREFMVENGADGADAEEAIAKFMA
jgi:hypothetical protein